MARYILYFILFALFFLIKYFARREWDVQLLMILLCEIIIVISTWFRIQKGIVDIYGTERTRRNPLYRLGYLRKPSNRAGGYHILSEIKGLYIRDIYVIIHLVIMSIYGIYSVFISRTILNMVYLMIWVAAAVFPGALVEMYYEIILKKSFKRKYKYQENFGPCRYSNIYGIQAEHFKNQYESYIEFINAIAHVCNERDYRVHEKYEFEESGEINIYVKQEKRIFKFLGIIYLPELTEADNKNIELFFKDFISKNVSLERIGLFVQSLFLICVEKENFTFRKLVHCSIRQKGIHFRGLNVGMTFDTQRFYIPRQNNWWGYITYQKMRKEIWDMLNS